MPFKDIQAFEIYLESLDELFDKGSIIVQEAEIFLESDKKVSNNNRRSEFGKRIKDIDKKVAR